MNCWESKNCDEQYRSRCPAYLEGRGLDCWKLTGTMCDGGRLEMASLEEKVKFCRKCDFYMEYAHKF